MTQQATAPRAATLEVESDGADASTGSLVQQAVEQGSRMIAAEIQLAKQEVGESVRAGLLALLGGVVAIFGVIAFLVMAIVTVIAAVTLHWAASLGFALFFLAVAVAGALFAVQRLKRISPLRQTIETVKEDVTWAKQQLKPGAK